MATPVSQGLMRQAAALEAAGQLEEATAVYVQALREEPTHIEALIRLGALLIGRGLFRPALAVLDQALALDPRQVAIQHYRADALLMLGEAAASLDAADLALTLAPRFAAGHCDRGKALQALGRHAEALAEFDLTLQIEPRFAEAIGHRGLSLKALRRHSEAIACYDAVDALAPGMADTACNRGVSLVELGQFDAAAANFDRAMQQAGGVHPSAGFNQALLSLLRGDLAAGWPMMEWRRQTPGFGLPDYAQPQWDGRADVAGRTVLVYAEQGLGDTIQFCRFLIPLQALGARIVFACQPRLKRLMSSLALDPAGPPILLIDQGQAPARFDYHLALMSLPLAFDARLESIPRPIPYLAAEPERVDAWRARLGNSGFRIGVSWAGNPTGDPGRAFTARHLRPIAERPGTRLISLQQGAGEEEAISAGFTIETLGAQFDDGPDAFADTAAVMMSLDLIITTDTAIAHLAGALGRPVWLALKQIPDWRWLMGRSDSPWYPSMRLFRQAAADDWDGVFLAMRRALEEA